MRFSARHLALVLAAEAQLGCAVGQGPTDAGGDAGGLAAPCSGLDGGWRFWWGENGAFSVVNQPVELSFVNSRAARSCSAPFAMRVVDSSDASLELPAEWTVVDGGIALRTTFIPSDAGLYRVDLSAEALGQEVTGSGIVARPAPQALVVPWRCEDVSHGPGGWSCDERLLDVQGREVVRAQTVPARWAWLTPSRALRWDSQALASVDVADDGGTTLVRLLPRKRDTGRWVVTGSSATLAWSQNAVAVSVSPDGMLSESTVYHGDVPVPRRMWRDGSVVWLEGTANDVETGWSLVAVGDEVAHAHEGAPVMRNTMVVWHDVAGPDVPDPDGDYGWPLSERALPGLASTLRQLPRGLRPVHSVSDALGTSMLVTTTKRPEHIDVALLSGSLTSPSLTASGISGAQSGGVGDGFFWVYTPAGTAIFETP